MLWLCLARERAAVCPKVNNLVKTDQAVPDADGPRVASKIKQFKVKRLALERWIVGD